MQKPLLHFCFRCLNPWTQQDSQRSFVTTLTSFLIKWKSASVRKDPRCFGSHCPRLRLTSICRLWGPGLAELGHAAGWWDWQPGPQELLPTKASFGFGRCHDFFSKGCTLRNGHPDFETQPYVASSSSLLFVDSKLNRCRQWCLCSKGLDPRGFFVCSICGEQGRTRSSFWWLTMAHGLDRVKPIGFMNIIFSPLVLIGSLPNKCWGMGTAKRNRRIFTAFHLEWLVYPTIQFEGPSFCSTNFGNVPIVVAITSNTCQNALTSDKNITIWQLITYPFTCPFIGGSDGNWETSTYSLSILYKVD